LAGVRGPDEEPYLLSRRFVGVGGAHGERVHAAVDVRVIGLVDRSLGLDHRARLLGGGGVVEVDEGPAVDPLPQDRELAADLLDVQGGRGPGSGGVGCRAHASASWISAACGNRDWRKAVMPARIASTLIRPTRSLAKAQVRR